jgi:hypothetical protein
MAILADEMRRAAAGPQLVFVMKVLPGLEDPAEARRAVGPPAAAPP